MVLMNITKIKILMNNGRIFDLLNLLTKKIPTEQINMKIITDSFI